MGEYVWGVCMLECVYAVYVSFCVFVCVCGWVGRWVSMCECGLNLKDFSCTEGSVVFVLVCVCVVCMH